MASLHAGTGTRLTLMVAAFFSACAKSYCICIPSQTSGLPPKALDSRMAIPGLTPFLPLTRLLRVRRDTPSTSAALVMLRLRGLRQSSSTCSPGCGGFFIAIGRSPSLVIVDQINVSGVLSLKAEDHTPIGFYGDGPEAFQFPFQRVKPEAWRVHVARRARLIQPGEDATQFFYILGADFAAVVILEESFQTLVPKASYHRCGV